MELVVIKAHAAPASVVVVVVVLSAALVGLSQPVYVVCSHVCVQLIVVNEASLAYVLNPADSVGVTQISLQADVVIVAVEQELLEDVEELVLLLSVDLSDVVVVESSSSSSPPSSRPVWRPLIFVRTSSAAVTSAKSSAISASITTIALFILSTVHLTALKRSAIKFVLASQD